MQEYNEEGIGEEQKLRALFIDDDSSQCSKVRKQASNGIVDQDCIVQAKEYAGGTFDIGYYQNYASADICSDKIRILAEQIDSLDGIILYSNMCGGFGSGFGTRLLDVIERDFSKCTVTSHLVMPSGDASMVEVYNSALSLTTFSDKSKYCIISSRQGIAEYLERMERVQHPSLNQICSMQARVGMTYLSLFQNPKVPLRMDSFLATQIPYPRINLALSSFATPHHDIGNSLTRRVIHPDSSLSHWQSLFDKSIVPVQRYPNSYQQRCAALSLIYSGCSLKDVSRSEKEISFKFEEFNPQPISQHQTLLTRKSALMLRNDKLISLHFDEIGKRFDKGYQKRMFLHWFVGNGLEEGLFTECREDLWARIKDWEYGGVEAIDENDEY
ncbi:hypothetical protein FGO68_gene12838 [Halteria grandinella]|uniref:Tubulin/FtsZ GTPase domain-containing protein n=1 Tax=Halteria grandinella TaxID=5974 RepID=A0A8J8T1A1_HALGN|nr:hypothetical protein FGO68_gene12838 [Halteria grandinella]